MKKPYILLSLLLLVAFFLNGCVSAAYHRRAVQDDKGDRITVGKVQHQITIGMPSAEVIEILGSPNVVSTDEERREVWVYDKVATDVVRSVGANGLLMWIIGAGGESGARSTSQRTLTIIVKFDKDDKVRDLAYHSSKF